MTMDYRREIDGLRAIAVLPVILFHAGFEMFSGGFVGVDVFFVISGYLITTIILAELEHGKFSIIDFYERRARRILPALYLVMLVCVPFAWFWLLPSDMKDFSLSLIAVSVFASNILFKRESGYFDTAAELKPLLHTWTLAVEEQYYIIFPLFLLLFWKLGKRWILVTLGLLFIASLALAQWGSYAKPAAAFYLLPTRVWELLTGVFAAFYLSQANRKDFGKSLNELGCCIGFALIIYAVIFYNKNMPFPGFYALVPTIGTVLIILFATPQTSFGRFIGNKVFVGLGLISYSAYLWHQPIFAFARHKGLSDDSRSLFLLLSLFSLVLAFLSWYYVEVPFRKRGIISRRLIFSLGIIFSSLFISIGFIGQNKNGFESRFERVLSGDIGHLNFHKYIDERYFDCEPAVIAENALTWNDFLRCKQSKNGTPEIVLLGDSHAEHLFLGLAEYIPNKNIGFYIFGEKPYIDADDFKLIFNEILNNNKPQHVVLAMHYAGRLDSLGSGLYEGFSGTIKALIKAGKSVSLVGDVPRFSHDPGLCVYSFSAQSRSSCVISRDYFERQSLIYENILVRLAEEYGLQYFSVYNNLCDEYSCSMDKGGVILYRDNNHLNIFGSQIIGKSLAERLMPK